MTSPFHLVREPGVATDEVVAALSGLGAERVGLRGVVSDLNRRAVPSRARPAPWAFAWDHEDDHSARWWPQGITTSADHSVDEEYAGRRIVLTSWYSKDVDGVHKGARITAVDLERLEYRHILLVDVVRLDDGTVDVLPLHVHAGGLLWRGDHLHVAATARGLVSFRLDDLLRVDRPDGRDELGATSGSFGYRYVLPVALRWLGRAEQDQERFRFSFLSLGRPATGGVPAELVAGEYGRGRMSTRLSTFGLDATGSLEAGPGGLVVPTTVHAGGPEGMQGATAVDGRWYVATSAGRFRRGSLYVGRPGALDRHRRALPVGVEDLTAWPSRRELWSLTEYPGRRRVFTLPVPPDR